MKIVLEILRFDPEANREPHFQKYELDAEPAERLLSVLMRIKRSLDPTLSFRKSCAHGVCGSDAMLVNGKERLACKTLVKDLVETSAEASVQDAGSESKATVRIEPLRTLPVQRDLMVEQSPFFDKYIQVKPYLITEHSAQDPVPVPVPVPERERVQSPQQRKAFDDGTNCILCASCYSACPVVQEKNPEFLGPAALVQAARFLGDSRDQGFEHRLPELDNPNGVWSCENHFECTRVCPRGIKVTRLINTTKRRIEKHRADGHT